MTPELKKSIVPAPPLAIQPQPVRTIKPYRTPVRSIQKRRVRRAIQTYRMTAIVQLEQA